MLCPSGHSFLFRTCREGKMCGDMGWEEAIVIKV